MGLSGFEPETSAMSRRRHDQLDHKPLVGRQHTSVFKDFAETMEHTNIQEIRDIQDSAKLRLAFSGLHIYDTELRSSK